MTPGQVPWPVGPDGKNSQEQVGVVEPGRFVGDDDAGPVLGVVVLLVGVVVVVVMAFLAGVLVSRLLSRPAGAGTVPHRPGSVPLVPPVPPPGPLGAADDDPQPDDVDGASLALGVIAAHDLVATDADRARLERALRRGGVTMILVQPGQEFDSRRHNAVATRRASADDGEAGPETITDVVRPGWQAGDRVLRPADVTVTSHGSWSARTSDAGGAQG